MITLCNFLVILNLMKTQLLLLISILSINCLSLEEAFRANNLFSYQFKNESLISAPVEKTAEKPKEKQTIASKELEQSVEENKRLSFLEDSLRTIEKDTSTSYEGMNKKLETLTSQLTKLTDKIDNLEKQATRSQNQVFAESPREQPNPQGYKTVATSSPSSVSLEKPEIRSQQYQPTSFSSSNENKQEFGMPSSFGMNTMFPQQSQSQGSQQITPQYTSQEYQPQSQQQQFMQNSNSFSSSPQIQPQSQANMNMNSFAIGNSPFNTNQVFSGNESSFVNQASSYSPRLRGANPMFGGDSGSNFMNSGSSFGLNSNSDFSGFGNNLPNYKTVSSYSNSNSNIGGGGIPSRNYYQEPSSQVEAETYRL